MNPFDGLTQSLPACLRELQCNNSREWFHAHREAFQRRVVAPLAALAEMLAPGVASIDGSLVGKLSRAQRDVRFSRDKSPYRTVMWFAFRRRQADWTEYPAFFFEAAPEYCRWGMGYYAARPATMSALRDMAQDNPERFVAALAAATERGFALDGDRYKRLPAVAPGLPGEVAELARRRNVYLCRTAAYAPPLLDGGLAALLAADFAALGAMYHLFCAANAQRVPGRTTRTAPAPIG